MHNIANILGVIVLKATTCGAAAGALTDAGASEAAAGALVSAEGTLIRILCVATRCEPFHRY